MSAKKKAAEKKQRQKKEHQQGQLDSALQDSFPASDPVSLTQPSTKDEPKTNRQSPRQEDQEQPAPGP